MRALVLLVLALLALLGHHVTLAVPMRELAQPLSFLQVEEGEGVMGADKRCHGVKDGPDEVGVPAKAPYTGSCCGGLHCPYTRARCCASTKSCCPFDSVCTAAGKCHWTQSGKTLVNPRAHVPIKSTWKLPANKPAKGSSLTLKVAPTAKSSGEPVPVPVKATSIPAGLLVTPKPEPTPLGAAWPPMGALGDDGRSGMWDARANLDWRGYGMVRNGTKNILPDLESCLDQCQVMEECRLAFYDYVTKQCWLDTQLAVVSDACPHSGDGTLVQRCASFFKKVDEKELKSFKYGETDTNPKHWSFTNMKDLLGPEHRSLTRSGFGNKVVDFHECLAQCADLKYCRVLTFFRPTRECWLGTAPTPGEGLLCARRNGKRDCVSALKKPAESELKQIVEEVKDLREGMDPYGKGEEEEDKEEQQKEKSEE